MENEEQSYMTENMTWKLNSHMAVHDLEYFQYNYTVWHAFFKNWYLLVWYTHVVQT